MWTLWIVLGFITIAKNNVESAATTKTKFFSPEAQDVAKQLQQIAYKLEKDLKNEMDRLSKSNRLVDDLKQFRDMYYRAEINSGGCEDEVENTYLNGEHKIDAIVEQCGIKKAKADKTAFLKSGLDDAWLQVKAIDAKIQGYTEECSQPAETCSNLKESALSELKEILSPSKKEEYTSNAKLVVANFKKSLLACFTKESKQLHEELEYETNEIDRCLEN